MTIKNDNILLFEFDIPKIRIRIRTGTPINIPKKSKIDSILVSKHLKRVMIFTGAAEFYIIYPHRMHSSIIFCLLPP